MIRTEADLVDVLEARAARAARAGTEHALLERLSVRAGAARDTTRPRTAVRTRRLILPLAAAVIVALAALIGTWVHGGDHGGEGGAADGGVSADTTVATSKAFYAYTFHLDEPRGFGVQSRRIEPTRQTIVYSADRAPGDIAGVPDVVEAVVYARGAFDPSTVRSGARLRIAAARGYFGPAPAHVRSAEGVDTTRLVPSVAWPYAADSWVVVSGVSAQYQSRAVELEIARTIHVGQPTPARVPFRIGYLPTGLHLTSLTGEADLFPADAATAASTAQFGRGSSASVVTLAATVVSHQSVRALFGTDTAPITVAGHPAGIRPLREGGRNQGHILTVLEDGFVLTVSGDPSVSVAELRAIGGQLDLVPAGSSPNTWFQSRTALPR